VKITASTVPIAVRLTERATLALAKLEIKLEIFPPGHEATKSIPKATEGVINRPKASTARKVTAGSSRNWLDNPIMSNRGLLKMFLKFSQWIPRATPNMIKPMVIFMMCKLAELKLSLMASS